MTADKTLQRQSPAHCILCVRVCVEVCGYLFIFLNKWHGILYNLVDLRGLLDVIYHLGLTRPSPFWKRKEVSGLGTNINWVIKAWCVITHRNRKETKTFRRNWCQDKDLMEMLKQTSHCQMKAGNFAFYSSGPLCYGRPTWWTICFFQFPLKLKQKFTLLDVLGVKCFSLTSPMYHAFKL